MSGDRHTSGGEFGEAHPRHKRDGGGRGRHTKPSCEYQTVQDLFDGTVLDTGDLDALLRKTREIKVAIKLAGGPNNGVPVQPTHTDSDCLKTDVCTDTVKVDTLPVNT